MSLIITVYVNDGIIMAADRRTTFTFSDPSTGKEIIHLKDSTDKLFMCPNGAGIAACGTGSVNEKPIAYYIREMIRTNITPNCSVKDMPRICIDYFNKLSPSGLNTILHIAGYDMEDGIAAPYACRVMLEDGTVKAMDTTMQGASWNGETAIMRRLMKDVALKNPDGSYTDMPSSSVLFEYFTLQDAVDFARYAVETTANTMHFLRAVETVGNVADVLVITPDDTEWLQKEALH